MTYIGTTPNYGTLHSQTITTANGSTATFTLDQYVADADSIIVTIGNVVQEPVTAYTASGNSITFTENVPNGDTIVIRYLGRQIDVPTSYTQSTRYKYVATNNQTTFQNNDANGLSLSYTVGNIDLFLNGVHLDESDFTASNGTSVVLEGSGAATNDELVIVAWKTVQISNALDKTNGGTVTGATTFSGAFTSKGIDDNADATSITIDSAENIGIKTTPKSWHGNWTAIDLGDQGHLGHYDGGDTQIGTNMYHDGGWKAKETGTSSNYALGANGYHTWFGNASANAGASVNLSTNMQLTINGELLKPKHPAFQAYYANNSYCWSDTTDGNFDLQTLNQTRFNRGNHYNTTNHRFVAPVAGIYHFYGQFYTNYSSNYARAGVSIRVNGSGRCETWCANWDTTTSAVSSVTLELAANDYVQLYTALYDGNATSNSYNVWCGAEHTYLTGHLIG